MAPLILIACWLVACAGSGPHVVNDDGAWCWFQDPRAIVVDDTLLVGSVSSGTRDPARRGDIELTIVDTADGSARIVELHDRLELDDHDAPALLALPDRRVLAVYARHGRDDLVRYRHSAPVDPTSWTPERTFALGRDDVTYANLVHLGDGRIACFFRGIGWDPTAIVSDDGGETWRIAGRVLAGPGRPYVRYASDGRGIVHLIATEQHPRDADTGIWHGVLRRGGAVHDSAGATIGAIGDDPPLPGALTAVYEGGPDRVAWTVDLELGADGRPAALFSVQRDGAGLATGRGGMDHRYHYARWDGAAWREHEIAYAGTRLYAGEDDYTALAAIDPDDVDVVYISTNAAPDTGAPLVSAADGKRHYEIFAGRTTDGGATWRWRAITRDSTADNIRPIVPRWSAERTALLWLRGAYRSYTDYDLEIVLLLDPPGPAAGDEP